MLNLSPATLISRIIVLVIAFTIHEFAHAYMADRFGDDTPRHNGRLTLNPLAHLDPMGSLLLLVAGFGWAKPVPINPYTLRRHSDSAIMWVSLAGPLSNLMLALIAVIPFRLGIVSLTQAIWDNYASAGVLPTLSQLMLEFIFINLALMLFNLIPLPPLDGDKILAYFLPPEWEQRFAQIRPYGSMILIGLFIMGPYMGLNFVQWIIIKPINAFLQFML